MHRIAVHTVPNVTYISNPRKPDLMELTYTQK